MKRDTPAERRSSGSFELVRANQKVGRNFPCLADLVDHINPECTPAQENFRFARARAEEFGEFSLGVPEFLHRITEYVDWIKTLVGFDRPPFRFVKIDERDKHLEFVAFLAALRRTPIGLDLCERRAVIFVRIGRISITCFPLAVRTSTRSYSACVPMNFTKAICRRKSKGSHQAIIPSRNLEPHAVAVRHLGVRSRLPLSCRSCAEDST